MRENLNIEIFSGDFIGKGHTISQLAKFGTKVLNTENVRITLFTDNQNIKSSEKSVNYIPSFEKYISENKAVSIFHLGNNRTSLPVFNTLVNTQAKINIVILHDIYLGDLFANLLQNKNAIEREIIYHGALGKSDYLLYILHTKNQNVTDRNFKARLSVKFLNQFIPKGTILIHSENQTYIKELMNYKEPENLHMIDLPIGYHEIKQQKETLNSYDLILSGHQSPAKQVDKIVSQLELLCQEKDLKILFLGSLTKEIETKHSKFVLNNKVHLIQSCSDDEWDKFHSRSKLGIRLGVGEQGEKSGTVRDYLVYGMQVISDEETNHFQKFTNFHFYKATKSLASLISAVLDNTSDGKKPQKQDNVKEYYEKILSIIDWDSAKDSETPTIHAIPIEKRHSYPVVNIEFVRQLSSKFKMIYFIDAQTGIWKLNLRKIFSDLQNRVEFNETESLEVINSRVVEHAQLIPYEDFLSLNLDPESDSIVIESLTNLVWINGIEDCQKVIELASKNQISLFLYKETRNTKWLNTIINFGVVFDLIIKIAPWQSCDYKTGRYEPNQRIFFISEKFQINREHCFEDKKRIHNSRFKDFKSLENVTYISDSLLIKHVPATDSRSTSLLFSEYKNWIELSDGETILGEYNPKPELVFNPWGACLIRSVIEGKVLSEIKFGRNKVKYLNLVFNEASKYGNLNLYPNDLRPWNIIVGNKDVQFIDFMNDIRKDQDADGIPQVFALHLTLEYIRNQDLQISEKLKEIRLALSAYKDYSMEELDSVFAQCWKNLEEYKSLLLTEVKSSEIVKYLFRKSENVKTD